ncbi:MAG TPA: hypothetical protein PLZ36_15200 [Armatimonadota bacterium]|nr:hypothetical protein [Armatimonadota bacterium]
MDALLSPEVLQAAGMVVLGVALYGLAPCLPSLFPRWFTRMMGCWVVALALSTLWLLTWSWQATALLGALALAALLIISAWQGRRRAPALPDAATGASPVETADADPPERKEN